MAKWASDTLTDLGIRDAADVWAGTHENLGNALRLLFFPQTSGGLCGKYVAVARELMKWSLAKHEPSRVAIAMVRAAAIDLFIQSAEAQWDFDG